MTTSIDAAVMNPTHYYSNPNHNYKTESSSCSTSDENSIQFLKDNFIEGSVHPNGKRANSFLNKMRILGVSCQDTVYVPKNLKVPVGFTYESLDPEEPFNYSTGKVENFFNYISNATRNFLSNKWVRRGLGVLGGFLALNCIAVNSPEKPIPVNHPPTITTSPINDINEGYLYNYDVDATDQDKDTLDYSLDNNYGWLSINSDTGIISGTAPLVESDSPFDIQVNVSDGKSFTSQYYTLTVKDIPHYISLSGKLEDCENHTERTGVIKIYDTKNADGSFSDPLTIQGTSNNAYSVGADGNFSFTLDKLVNSEDKIYIRGATGPNWDNKTSYIKTTTFSAEDNSEIKVRPLMYDNPDSSYDDGLLDAPQKRIDFKEYLGRTNFWSAEERIANNFLNGVLYPDYINGNSSHGLKKTNFFDASLPDYIQGVEVNSGEYTLTDYNTIRSAISSTLGPIAPVLLSKLTYGKSHQDQTGWGSVCKSPDGSGPYAFLIDSDANGYIDRFLVYLNTLTSPKLIGHELLYHGQGNSGHSDGYKSDGTYIPELFNSIGKSSSPYPSNNTAADIKREHIIKEDTNLGMDSLDDTLGLN